MRLVRTVSRIASIAGSLRCARCESRKYCFRHASTAYIPRPFVPCVSKPSARESKVPERASLERGAPRTRRASYAAAVRAQSFQRARYARSYHENKDAYRTVNRTEHHGPVGPRRDALPQSPKKHGSDLEEALSPISTTITSTSNDTNATRSPGGRVAEVARSADGTARELRAQLPRHGR